MYQKARKGPPRSPKTRRIIEELRQNQQQGRLYPGVQAELARKYGVSRQRIQQLAKREGLRSWWR